MVWLNLGFVQNKLLVSLNNLIVTLGDLVTILDKLRRISVDHFIVNTNFISLKVRNSSLIEMKGYDFE